MKALEIVKEVPRSDTELFAALRAPLNPDASANLAEFRNFLKAEFFALKDFMAVFGKTFVWEAKIDSLYTCSYYSVTYEGESLVNDYEDDSKISDASEEELYVAVRAQLLDKDSSLYELDEGELHNHICDFIKCVRESAYLAVTKVLGVPYGISEDEIEEIKSNDMADLADFILFEDLPEFDKQLGTQDAVDFEQEDINGVLVHVGSEASECHLSINGKLNSDLPLVTITWGSSSYKLNLEKGEVRITADGVDPAIRAPSTFDYELAIELVKDLFTWAREKLGKS